MRILWDERAWEEYLSWQVEDKKILKKINALIKDIQRNPFEGIGKPELLKDNLSGWWSRRIDSVNRVVYKVMIALEMKGDDEMLEIGTKAPAFTLPDQNGEMRSLADYQGQKIILYFYPKDMTAGCTKQACAFGNLYPQFREKGAVILGVSKDSVASHKKFEEKYGLPFTLLSDPEKEVIQAYDVWKEKKNYGKVSMGVVRTTYLIDENGIIVKAFDKVKAADNPAQMLGELE